MSLCVCVFGCVHTFFLGCGSLLVAALLVGSASVALLLQEVADEDPQQAHDAEDGHQREHRVFRGLLLRATHVGGVRCRHARAPGGALPHRPRHTHQPLCHLYKTQRERNTERERK